MLLGKRTGQCRILALFAVLTLLLVTLLGSFPPGVKAESNVHQWTGAIDNNWDTGGNWDTEVVPGSGHTAVIPPGKLVNIASGTVNVCLQNQGNLTVLSGAAIELANGSELIAGGISGDGTVSIEAGSTTWSGGTFDGNGFVLIQSNGTLQVTGGDKVMSRPVSNRGAVSVDVDYGKKLTFTNSYSDFSFATIKITGGRMVEFSGACAFNVNGDIDDLTNCAYFTASNSATVTFSKSYNVRNTYVNSNATATWAALEDDTARVLGLVSITGGTAILNGDTSCLLKLHSGTVKGSGNITLLDKSEWGGGDIEGAGDLTIPSGATLTLQGNASKSSERNLILSGTLKCKIGPVNTYAAASTTGSMTLNEGSSLHVELFGGYVPNDNSKLPIISCSNPPLGNFSTVTSNNSALTLSSQYATEHTPPCIVAVVRHADATPPVLIGRSPAPEATDVPKALTVLTLTFDEPVVKQVEKYINVYKKVDSSLVMAIEAVQTTVEGAQVTVNLGEGLFDYEISYYITIDHGAFQDASGNEFPGIAPADGWDFTIENAPDTSPPVWAAGYPTATAITETGFTLVGKTDEAGSLYYAVLAKNSTEPTSAEVENGTGAIKHGSAAMTTGTECSCAITELTAETDYDVYVVAEDNSGNLQAAPVKLEVTTSAASDITAPQIIAHSPAHQEDMIEVTTSTLTITFDEPVWSVDGKKIKINRVDGVYTPTVATIDVGSEAVTGQGTGTITVTLPEQTLTYEKSYNVIIDSAAFKDAANNLSASYGGATQWNFATKAIWSPNYPVLGNIREGFGGVWVDVYAHSPYFATAYCVVTQDEYAPSSQQIKEGKDRSGTALPEGFSNSGTIDDVVCTLQLKYLESDSEYYVYVILEDVNGIMTLPKQLKLRTPLAAPPDTPFWNQRSPLPTVNSLQKVVYAPATQQPGTAGFRALGSHGALAYSSDGETWEKRNTHTTFNLTGLTKGMALYYAVANDGTTRSLLLSSDPAGVTWSHELMIQDARLSDLVYAKNLLVAVADGGKIIVWRDLYSLHNYELFQLDYSQNLTSITYADGTFVAVGRDGVVATSTNGYSWTVQQLNPQRHLEDVVYANDKLVAIGMKNGENTYAFWSTNKGASWTAHNLYTPVDFESIMHDGTRFVALGYGNAATSSDAFNWTFLTPADLRNHVVNGGAFANGKFIVVGGWGDISISTNLNDWSHVTQGVTKQLKSVAWGNSCFVAIGELGTIVTSPDGINWQAQNSGTTNAMEKVRYLGNQFVAVGSKQTILTSPDGTVWTVRKSEETSNGLLDVAYGAGKYIAVGVNGTMFSSGDNGVTWTAVSLGTSTRFNAITYGGGWFVALGEYKQVYRSNDGGMTWQASNLSDNYAQDIIYLNGLRRFVATGPSYAQYSDDAGATWNRVPHGVSSYIYSLAEKDGRLIAVGQNGSIIVSLDNGANWTKQEFPNDINTQVRVLSGVVAGPSNFVIVGNWGLILQSTGFGPGPNLDAQAVAAAKAALTWDVIKGENLAENQILHNLTLPIMGEQGTTITWSVTPAGYVLLDGTVIRPDAETGNKDVILTAFISKGEASDKKAFNLTVISQERSDAEAVAADKALLTWDLIDLENEAQDAVTSDLFLPVSGPRWTTITWTADPTGHVDTLHGTVTRPDSGSEDVSVTLTATVSKGDVSDTVVFNLVVKAMPTLSADEAIVRDAAALTDDVIRGANTALNQVTSSLNLPAAGANGTTIAWTADPTGHINTATGAVTRPEHSQGNRTVTLTATVSKEGGTSQTKTFTITIKAKDAPYVPGPVDPIPDVPTQPQPTSVITALTTTAADRLLDRSLLTTGQASVSLAALGENPLTISTAVAQQLALHNLSITLIAPNMTFIIDPAALLLEQVNEWRKGKAWFEISIDELTGEELDAVAEAWQLPAREGRLNVLVSIYQITLQYWEEGQESGLDISELLQAITVKHLLPEGLSEQELALLKVILAGTEIGATFSPSWLEALYDEDSGLLTFSTDRLGHFALVLLESPTFVIDLTIDNRAGQVNGVERIMDVPPCLVGNRTLVPVRFVSEAMGAKVSWNASTRTVRIKLNGQVVDLVIGQTDPAKGLDVPAQIFSNRTLVPLRFVSESLGASVRWLPATRGVEIVMFSPPTD